MHLNPVDYNKFNIKQGQEVNPVEIWEGIDTREETGRNRLMKLAIHILSIVLCTVLFGLANTAEITRRTQNRNSRDHAYKNGIHAAEFQHRK